ncbi:hypothetical protein BH09BAC3_BH09BAC3_36120 [soil metagenome]
MQGLRKHSLAVKLGIKRSKLGAFEEFRSLPRLKDAVKIAELFEVNLDTLVSSDMSKQFGR